MLKKIKKNILSTYPLYLLLIVYFLFALLTYKDYGITLDEPRVYQRGRDLLEYYSQKTSYKNTIEPTYDLEPKKQRHAPLLSNYYNGYAAFLSVFNKQASFERYHFYNFVFASILIIVSYLVIYKEYENKSLALIIPLIILTTPRFLGHIPANPKDTPFAVIYISALFFIHLLESSPKKAFKDPVAKSLILGIVFGLVQSMRIVGYSIYPIFLLYLAHKFIFEKGKIFSRTEIIYYLKIIFLTTIFSHFFALVTWPYLGSNLLKNLPALLNSGTNFEAWNKDFLFMGNYIDPQSRPNVYIFYWLLVTTPVFYLILFFTGVIIFLRNYKNRLFFLFVISFLLQTLIYLALKPNIYNGLRHYLFYLVNLLVIVGLTFIKILDNGQPLLKKPLVTILLLTMSFNIYKMVKLHPYQYISFNVLSGGLEQVQGRLPLDYWGASYKEAAEWVVKEAKKEEDPREKDYLVHTCNASFAVAYYGRGHFSMTDEKSKADYLICQEELPNYQTIHHIKRDNVILNYVYQNK